MNNVISNEIIYGNLSTILKSCIGKTNKKYIAFEGLAGTGKTSTINKLKLDNDFSKKVKFLDELNLPLELQKSVNFLDNEVNKQSIINNSIYNCVSDRSILSTIMVAVAKILSNFDIESWFMVEKWFDSENNRNAFEFPSVFIYTKIDVKTSIDRQLSRNKYRRKDSFFLSNNFCRESGYFYDFCFDFLIKNSNISVLEINTNTTDLEETILIVKNRIESIIDFYEKNNL